MSINDRRFMFNARGIDATWTPANLTGLWAWYKADEGVYSDAGVTPAVDTDAVQYWADQSGNAHHADSYTGAPTYDTSSLINSKTGTAFITFPDTANDNLNGTGFTSATEPLHSFIIFRVNTSYVVNDCLLNLCSSQVLYLRTYNPGADNICLFDGTNQLESAATPPAPAVGSWGMLETVYNGNSSTIAIDNQTIQTASTMGSGTADLAVIGARTTAGANAGKWSIAEIVVVDGEVSGVDLTSIRTYFSNKYGVTTQ